MELLNLCFQWKEQFWYRGVMTVLRMQSDAASSAPNDVRPGGTRNSRFENAGLDLLRSMAAMAVVFLHACVPYLKHPMPGLIWPVSDRSSTLVDIAFWAIEVVIMPVFLILAGFFVWRSACEVSPALLLKRRAKRLLLPLGFGCLFVLPADIYIWTLGLVSEGIVPAVKLKSLKFDGPVADQIWGLSHLWFLLYVFLYVAVTALAMHNGWVSIRQHSSASGRRQKSWILALLTIATVSLFIAPEVVWGFQHAFLPVPSKWIYSGCFFAMGWCLASRDPELRDAALDGPRQLMYGLILLGVAVAMGRWFLAQAELSASVSFMPKLLLTVTTVAAATFVSMGAMGTAAGRGRMLMSVVHPRVQSLVKYFAAASLWVYLLHHPLLGLLHVDLKWLAPNVSPVIKLLLAFAGSGALCLATFEVLVVRTRLGFYLGLAKRSGTPRLRIHEDAGSTLDAEQRSQIEQRPPRRRAA